MLKNRIRELYATNQEANPRHVWEREAYSEDPHDLSEAGGLAVAHGSGQVGEVVGRHLLEGLALGRAQLLHYEPVVPRLGEE